MDILHIKMDTLVQYECMSLDATEHGSDDITCLKVSEKLLAIGRESGRLDLVDYNGDVITQFHEHCGAVRDVCFDHASPEYLASCSDDGSAVMYSVYDGCIQKYVVENGTCPLSAVALDPRCSSRKTKEIVAGDGRGRVHLLSSGWLGRSGTVLFSGKHRIDAIIWSGTLVAWSSLSGVWLYDVSCHAPVGMVASHDGMGERDRITMMRCACGRDVTRDVTVPGESYRKQGYDLFIGSVSSVYHIRIPLGTGVPRRDVRRDGELDKSLVFASEEGGIASFVLHPSDSGGNWVTILMRESARKVYSVVVVDSLSLSIDRVCKGSVPIPLENATMSLSENLVAGPDMGEPLFFIQSAKTVTMAKSLDAVTRLGCLCHAGLYEEAIHLIETNAQVEIYRDDLIEKYMHHIMENESTEMTGSLAAMLLRDDIAAWERWTTTLARAKKVHHIAADIPYQSQDGGILLMSTYDIVIKSCFQQRKYETTKKLVETWPVSLYSAHAILAMAKERLESEPESSGVLSDLALNLYTNLGMYQEAIELLVMRSDERIFEYIQEHARYVGFHLPNLVRPLMEMDEKESIRILVDNRDVAPASDVVTAVFIAAGLEEEIIVSEMNVNGMGDTWGHRLYGYLQLLHQKDPSMSTFDTLLINMCARYDPENIMNLLQSSNAYNLESALKSCMEHDLLHGQVFVLGKMGLMVDALNIIIHKMHDISAAVSFARDNMDGSVWEELSRLAVLHEDLVSELLEYSGDGIDTEKLLQSIPPEMTIPDLKRKLIQASKRVQQEVAVQNCCLYNAHSDCSQLLHLLYKQISAALNMTLCNEGGDFPILWYQF